MKLLLFYLRCEKFKLHIQESLTQIKLGRESHSTEASLHFHDHIFVSTTTKPNATNEPWIGFWT